MIEFLLANPYLTIWVFLALMFERALVCGYVADDDTCFFAMRNWKKTWKDKKNRSFDVFMNFLKQATYGAGLFKTARYDHLAQIILHGINCSLIYRASGSLLAALLYLINPINNQTTLWLNGRRYAISIMMVLIAWNFWWTAPFMAACAWVHVSGAVFPLLFLWTPFWPMVPVAGAMAFLFGRNKIASNIRGRRAEYANGNEILKIRPKKIILYIKTIGYNFFNCLIPHSLGMYNDFLFYFGVTEEGTKEGYSLNFQFWIGLATVATLGYLIIFQHSFWAFWFVLFISSWCNVLQVTMNSANRYCSLSGIGVMCLVADYGMKIPHPYNIITLSFLASYYIVKYQPLFRMHMNIYDFFLSHIYANPALVYPRIFLAKIFLTQKEPDPWQAFGIVRQGLRYRPKDFKLLICFIDCLINLRRPRSALQAIDYAEKYVPLGEEEDARNLFSGIRKDLLSQLGHKVIHNNGKPVVNKEKVRSNKSKRKAKK